MKKNTISLVVCGLSKSLFEGFANNHVAIPRFLLLMLNSEKKRDQTPMSLSRGCRYSEVSLSGGSTVVDLT